jgi:hypothetical protein
LATGAETPMSTDKIATVFESQLVKLIIWYFRTLKLFPHFIVKSVVKPRLGLTA